MLLRFSQWMWIAVAAAVVAVPACAAVPRALGESAPIGGRMTAAAALAPVVRAPVAQPVADLQPLLPVGWARELPPVTIRNASTEATASFRLYGDDGQLDSAAAEEVDRVLWGTRPGPVQPVNRRLLQLVVRAAAHFDAPHASVISSWRESKRSGSRHKTGDAIDLVLAGVPAAALAAHLRDNGRVGVGVYTHPRTRFVHLDVREQSFHWVDGSPPGRTWREKALFDPGGVGRDAAHDPLRDLPAIAGLASR